MQSAVFLCGAFVYPVGERVLARHRASITARDPAPVVRRMIPVKKCSNDEHALLILQWTGRLGVYRELLNDSKYDNARAPGC